MIGFELNRLSQFTDGIISFSRRGEKQCVIVMGLGRIWFETRGCFILWSGFVTTANPLEQVGVLQMKLTFLWLEAQRLFRVRDGLIKFGLSHQSHSKVHMRFRIGRIQTEGDFVLCFCLLPSALFL